MNPTTTMATPPGEMEEQAVGHGLVLGVMIGIPLLLAALSVAVLLTGAGLSTALQVAGWPAIVAGPYAGGFIVLTRAAARHATTADVHTFPTSGAVGTARRAAA